MNELVYLKNTEFSGSPHWGITNITIYINVLYIVYMIFNLILKQLRSYGYIFNVQWMIYIYIYIYI